MPIEKVQKVEEKVHKEKIPKISITYVYLKPILRDKKREEDRVTSPRWQNRSFLTTLSLTRTTNNDSRIRHL